MKVNDEIQILLSEAGPAFIRWKSLLLWHWC